MLVLIKFKVRGNLRFLSHAETMRVFQRACVRAGIKIAYSQGFNPRPRMSLPLPRSVGVESDDDLLCLRVEVQHATDKQPANSASSFDSEQLKARLCEQLPEGLEVLAVSVAKDKVSFQAGLVTYVFAVRQEHLNEALKARIEHLLESEHLELDRTIDSKGNIRNVDVRGFLKSVELGDKGVTAECKVSTAGSIRVDEIMRLLELDTEKLSQPIRRTRVQWQN